MKFRKGDKIIYAGYNRYSGKLEFDKSLSYNLIIGVIDKKYYAIESWHRTSTRARKYQLDNYFLRSAKVYESEVKTACAEGAAKIERKKK